jgi:hypothetical protein
MTRWLEEKGGSQVWRSGCGTSITALKSTRIAIYASFQATKILIAVVVVILFYNRILMKYNMASETISVGAARDFGNTRPGSDQAFALPTIVT